MTDPKPDQTPESGPATPAAPVHVMPDDSSAFALAERAVWLLLEKKGEDTVILDLRGRSDVCDFYVVATGRSDQQVSALAKHIYNGLVAFGDKPKGVEGMQDGRWALLDFFDVVVHVFREEAREYFRIEELWGDAPRLDLEPEHFAADDVAARHPDLKFTFTSGS